MIEVARSADFVIVQAARRSRLTEIADIVLPALPWFERKGAFRDLDGAQKEIERIVNPDARIKSDRGILEDLSERNSEKGLLIFLFLVFVLGFGT